ncbi:MAG: septation regulator SpoVG [Acidobacteria bacterium]|nr:septation regulator SpoVG [Acidobacteriota bacterium]
MEITDIRVFPVDEDKLKAFVTIVFDQCFVVSDIKVINGTSGLFISMPSKRRKNGTFRDVAHPLNSETRRMIEEKVLAKYEEALALGVSPRRLRKPREAAEDEADHAFEFPAGGGDPAWKGARTSPTNA